MSASTPILSPRNRNDSVMLTFALKAVTSCLSVSNRKDFLNRFRATHKQSLIIPAPVSSNGNLGRQSDYTRYGFLPAVYNRLTKI